MYKLHLILKYLRRRRIAWVSLLAVMLCTTMVLVVISVMGGWLRMFRQSFHGLSGDVLVQSDGIQGFPHYQEMIDRIRQLPEVQAAVPTICTVGLINIGGAKIDGVQVYGFPIDQIGQVNRFPQSLYLQYQRYLDAANDPHQTLTEAQRSQLRRQAEESARHPSFQLPLDPKVYRDAIAPVSAKLAPERRPDPTRWSGMIAGAGVLNICKDQHGNIINRDEGLYRMPVKLTLMDVNARTAADMTMAAHDWPFWIVDDSRTQVWQYDSRTVYIPFDLAQRAVGMAESDQEPARVSEIHIKVHNGVPLPAVRDKVQAIVTAVLAHHQYLLRFPPKVQTWEESQSLWLDAIENEKVLVVFLFGIISMVAVFLIFCIFYMIVAEKTRDIGIIKSVGATSRGVAAVFLGYGLAIGIVGAGLGLVASYGIVHNINQLHTWLGDFMGIQIWKPEVYAFDTIPNTMNGREVTVILLVAILSSVLGALVPAIRAARMHPVEALRWE